ncbi:MAG TPA: chromosome partitioning protein ParB, partial [Amycolatopsis sp.]|nr:chromosome partitioning protein ParB [Amycolatopsis sp.]
EVLTRLGLQLSPRKARELVRAFAEMPREVAEEMDEAKVSLHTRIRFVELRRGREQAAQDIWAAVKNTGRTRLLPSALAAASADENLSAEQALAEAERVQEQADSARAEKLRAKPEAERRAVDSRLVERGLAVLRQLLLALVQGAELGQHDRGSLVLLLDQLGDVVHKGDSG